ncbi:MAG: hypothetical protein WB441_17220 [Nocardioidaceae bacterium]
MASPDHDPLNVAPPDKPAAPGPWRPARALTAALVVATVGQLAVAQFVPGIPQFEGKAFGARLVAYPVLMVAPVAIWWLLARRRTPTAHRALPWPAFACIAAPFLIDVTGNTLDLYDTVSWWDDANHFVNWLLLCLGAGLMLLRSGLRQRWALATIVTGIGAILAIGWELAEWYTFIRHGTELAGAYTDTLGDEALGTLGGAVAGVLVAIGRR